MAPKKDAAGSVKSPVEAVPASQSSGKAPTALESKRVELERRLSLVSSELTDDEVAAVMGRFEPSKLIHDFNKHLTFSLAKDRNTATQTDYYTALARTVRDQLVSQWIKTSKRYKTLDVKRVYYISLEYYMGRTLQNTVINLGMDESIGQMLHELGMSLEDLKEEELDAGLGNGGLGRLAACFLDSMATLGLPAMGYGLRYEYGIFKQEIVERCQVEVPDTWLQNGNPWEIMRPEYAVPVKMYGKTRWVNGGWEWYDTATVIAMPYDTPIPGYMNNTVNTLRLWSAKASNELDLTYFNHGDYFKSVEIKNASENITRVLYPNDNFQQGKELRLKQQYLLVAATMCDIIRRYKRTYATFDKFASKAAVQLNDTHPTLAIPELMRILIDVEKIAWDEAWQITTKTFSYTNHTILPEALEKWGVPLFELLLPRHLQIIYEVNARFLDQIAKRYPGDGGKLQRMSLIEEGDEKKVRMANLCVVGTHAINGVAALHSELIKKTCFRDFYEYEPHKFQNKTNGITPRRWLRKCNAPLSNLLFQTIGEEWVVDLYDLKRLTPYAKDVKFVRAFAEAKLKNKQALAKYILDTQGIVIDPTSMFDVQVKRIHEYKRQLMNLMHIAHLYLTIKEDPSRKICPRTVFLGGKAAPGYFTAKNIIKLCCNMAAVINSDPQMNGKLKLVFLQNYGVSVAEKVIPAADLSEQISTAGMEASGTGNMKFMANGALTIGTLDGANIEIKEEVGDENIFIFGMTVDQVNSMHGFNPRTTCYDRSPQLRRVLDAIKSGVFSPGDRSLFSGLVDNMLHSDYFCVLPDFDEYVKCQERVGEAFLDQERWMKMAVLNTANCGKFSSDRTIAEYARDIWAVTPAISLPTA